MAKIYGTPIMAGGGGGMNKDLPPLLDNFKASVQVEGIPVKDMPVGTKIKVPVNTDYQSFLGENIVWLVADQNHAGYPANSSTLLTERIIALLCADAKESTNSIQSRKTSGNNRHIYSNVLQWLNSDVSDGNWYSAKHAQDAPPTSENVWDNYNAYNNRPGFIAMLNHLFVENFIDTTLTVAKSSIDGGGYETFTSKIFLASVSETWLEESVATEGNLISLFNDSAYHIAYPTSECVTNSEYKADILADSKSWYWWLRTPLLSNEQSFYVNSYDGLLNTSSAYIGYVGIRPLCNISNETLLSPEPDSDGCYTLAELAPVTLAESDNCSVTLSADKMEESRAEQLAGAVWVYGDHSPANVNDGTKIQLTREECITPSLEGEDIVVNRAIPWSKTKDFYARQFTYNSKKQYQTMLEGALASVIVEGAPAQVTDLVVTGSGGTATLTWVNPVDDPVYAETVVVQKVGSTPSDITDGTEIYRGTDQTCTATGLEQSTDYYFAVYTVSGLGVYKQPVVSDVYSYDFPAEPTEYLEVEKIYNTEEWVAPETGYFKIVALAKSGDGGKPAAVKSTGVPLRYTAGGGGSGAIVVSIFKMSKGEKVFLTINSDVSVNFNDETALATSGKNGGGARDQTAGYGLGGAGGEATGGNTENINGTNGRGGKGGDDTGIFPGGAGATNSYNGYSTSGGTGEGLSKNTGDDKTPRTYGTAAYVVVLRGNTNTPSPSTASTLSLLPTDSALTVDWTNSGDPVQTGTMLVYNTNHVPTSVNDGVSVDIPATQASVATFAVDGEEQQADNKKQSYTITGLSNNKPVYVALFSYDANKKYGIPKTDIEIPRVHSWYDTQQELKQEVQEAEQEAQEATEQAEQAQEAVTMTRDFLPDAIALTMPQIYDEWDPNGIVYTGKDKATEEKSAAIVRRNGKLYRCLQSHTSQENWKPETSPSLWVEIADPALEWPEWKQPTGAHDAYAQGAKVSHNGKKWTSDIPANVYEPGVYGWTEVLEEEVTE